MKHIFLSPLTPVTNSLRRRPPLAGGCGRPGPKTSRRKNSFFHLLLASSTDKKLLNTTHKTWVSKGSEMCEENSICFFFKTPNHSLSLQPVLRANTQTHTGELTKTKTSVLQSLSTNNDIEMLDKYSFRPWMRHRGRRCYM